MGDAENGGFDASDEQAKCERHRSAKAYPYLRGTVVRFGDCLKDEW